MASKAGSIVRSESTTSDFSEELEFLENIYFEDLTLISCDQGSHTLSCHVTPSTGADKDKQFVFFDLQIEIPKEYPAVVPHFAISQSRGLSDAHLQKISEGLAVMSADLVGTSMLYELIEWARETLTTNNLPSEDCSICLLPFIDDEQFMKTECYHYYHLPCIAGYIQFYQQQVLEKQQEDSKYDRLLRKETKQLECPVCRVPISTPSLPPTLSHAWSRDLSPEERKFVPSDKLRAWQVQMETLLWRQKQKGGVIDDTEDEVIDSTTRVSSLVIRPKTESSAGSKDQTKIQKPTRTERKTSPNRSSTGQPGSRSYSVGKKTNPSRAKSAGSHDNRSDYHGNHSDYHGNRAGSYGNRAGNQSKRTEKSKSSSKSEEMIPAKKDDPRISKPRKSTGSIGEQ